VSACWVWAPPLPKRRATGAARNADFAQSPDGGATLHFLPRPKPIAESEIKETLTFDVVVVGAGASGVPAALSAAESGAKVAVIQKHPMPVSQGNTGSGIDLATSDKAGIEALVAKLMNDNNHRCNPALLRQWAYHSGEAVKWVIDRAKQGGAQVVDQGSGPQFAIRKLNGYTLNYVTSFMGPKPYTTGDGIRAMAKVAEKAGVKFFFRMPAVQLVQTRRVKCKASSPRARTASTRASWPARASSWPRATTRTTRRCATTSSPT
jgi:fumarate reductase flavoprotein subunit